MDVNQKEQPSRFRKGTAFAAGAAAAAVGQASAATITVNSLADTVATDAQCTLREALNNANANADISGGDCAFGAGADTIDLGSLAGTITLTGGQLTITDSTTFQGPAAGGLTISGGGASRVFYSGAAVDITITRLALSGGVVVGSGGAVGARFINSFTISNSTVSGNSSTNRGGGIHLYRVTGAVNVTNTTVTGNTATNRGGGLFLYQTQGPVNISSSVVSGNTSTISRGGGIFFYDNAGAITITDTTISGNTAAGNRGGGLFFYKSTAPVTIQRSTISGNTAASEGGGVFFYDTTAAITLEDTTISGNSSTGTGGGVFLRGGGQVLNIRSSTIVGNTAAVSSGNIDGGGGSPTINIANSIIAGGVAPATPDLNSNTATVNMDFSLLQNTSGAVFAGGNNITGVSPALGPLANNGGATQTHLPTAGSPVIDAGSAAIVPPPATDQRGLPRIAGPAPDMGSVEVQAALPPGVTLTAIPTLSQWALAFLASLMAWFGIRRARPVPRRIG